MDKVLWRKMCLGESMLRKNERLERSFCERLEFYSGEVGYRLRSKFLSTCTSHTVIVEWETLLGVIRIFSVIQPCSHFVTWVEWGEADRLT